MKKLRKNGQILKRSCAKDGQKFSKKIFAQKIWSIRGNPSWNLISGNNNEEKQNHLLQRMTKIKCKNKQIYVNK